MSIYELDAREFNSKLALELKKIPELEAPEWIYLVKSSVARERPIEEVDFWHKRTASILRQIYINGTLGVNKLKKRYGGKKNRGVKPSRKKSGGGKIVRLILQQSEKAGLLEKIKEGKLKGRKLTDKGKKLLEEIK
ncbi:MAG TPA: 40S ribosomal protein S19 [Candidatus Nanoarchaeia archaeon]|nr:40S ribosomal protein S19 [Candidatus Nanoarchaeia archaeon]